MRQIGLALMLCMITGVASAVDFNAGCFDRRGEVFVSGLQRFVKADKSKEDAVHKNKYRPTAVALGYQVTTNQWTAGFSVSYEHGKMEIADSGPEDRFDLKRETLGLTLFGTYHAPSEWYVSTSAFGGWSRSKFDTNGMVDDEELSPRGKTDNFRFGASLEVGKRFALGCDTFSMTPHIGLDYAYGPEDKYKVVVDGERETWTSPSQSFLEVPVGVRFAKDFVTCDWVVTPSLDVTAVATVNKINDESYNYHTGLASRTGDDWKIYGIGASRIGGRVTAGIKAVKSDRFDLDVKYGFEGRKDYTDHRIMAAFGLKF